MVGIERVACPAIDDNLDESRTGGALEEAVLEGRPEYSIADCPAVLLVVACSMDDDIRDWNGGDTVSCPMPDDSSETCEAAELRCAPGVLDPNAFDEMGWPVGNAMEVLPKSDENNDCCSGIFVALPSFNVNSLSADERCSWAVGKAVEICFAMEDNLDESPGRFVSLPSSELREFNIWENCGFSVGMSEGIC